MKKSESIVNATVLIFIFLFLISYFKPEYLLLKTTISGGDTASQYYPAHFLKESLLPKLKIVGWCHGWYAGIPMFQFYFPLLFVVSAIMSYLIPLQISFKLVTILGTFLLPIAAFLCMKFMRFKFPIPIIAAIFTLPFLFNQGNSMWGGNIPSTLAGEFSFSFSLSLMILLSGLMYRGIEEKRFAIKNSIIFALMALTHIITVMVFVLASSFFLLRKKFFSNLKYLLLVYFLAFLLIAFWFLPLVLKLKYTTPFFVKWFYSDARKEIFPDVLVPFYFLSFFGLFKALKVKDKRIFFLLYFVVISIPLYYLSSKLGIVDIRFIPFIQLLPLLVAAYGLGELTNKLKKKWILPLIILLLVAGWVQKNTTYIDYWIKWNYSGFEQKELWPAFSSVNEFLKGNENDPRVVYEHSALHDSAGSLRAFESLPLFSGRSTLEGLYMQSIGTSPFVFYIQSEISEVTSCPFPDWSPCSVFNSTKAARHLEMFNVKHVIARTETVKAQLNSSRLYKSVAKFEPFEIYELVTNKNRYTEVPSYEPVVFKTDDWKRNSYEWFKREDILDVPLVFNEDDKQFSLFADDLNRIPKVPIESNCNIQENVQSEEIKIKTNCVGKPHIIKVSYYPNWKVEGAEKIYLVSPSFMLIYPQQENVRIYYGKTFADIFGEVLTYLGIILLIILFLRQKVRSLPPR
jgi:uncharacterized membrane protein